MVQSRVKQHSRESSPRGFASSAVSGAIVKEVYAIFYCGDCDERLESINCTAADGSKLYWKSITVEDLPLTVYWEGRAVSTQTYYSVVDDNFNVEFTTTLNASDTTITLETIFEWKNSEYKEIINSLIGRSDIGRKMWTLAGEGMAYSSGNLNIVSLDLENCTLTTRNTVACRDLSKKYSTPMNMYPFIELSVYEGSVLKGQILATGILNKEVNVPTNVYDITAGVSVQQ